MKAITTPPKTCELCGTEFHRQVGKVCPAAFAKRRFCSNRCSNTWRMRNGFAAELASRRDPATLATNGRRGGAAFAEKMHARRAVVIEDVEWIVGTDHPENIARRLGYTNAENLATLLRRWGREDLSARLHAMEAVA